MRTTLVSRGRKSNIRFYVVAFLFIATICLGFTGGFPANGQAAPPPSLPHDTNCDSLIDKKVARTDRLVDDPIVVDGRFYDVGRNPDPVGTLPKTDYGDFRFRVSHIKFDWKDNVGTGPAGQPIPTFDEGFNLRRDNTAGDLGKYEHRIDQKSRGEWIYQFYTPDGAHAGRNEPALYAAGKKGVNLKVRVECANPVNYAWVGDWRTSSTTVMAP